MVEFFVIVYVFLSLTGGLELPSLLPVDKWKKSGR